MITVQDARLTHRQELKENLDTFLNSKNKDIVKPTVTEFPGYLHVTYFRDMREDKCKKYRLVVYSKWIGDAMMQTFIIASNAKPLRKIGIILFEADESIGELKMLYCLPKDVPIDPKIITVDTPISSHIYEQAKDLKVIVN